MRYYWAYKYNKPLSWHPYCIFKYNKDILSVSTLIEVVKLEEIVVLVAANGELILELATTQFVEFAHACFGEVLTQLCGIKDDTRS